MTHRCDDIDCAVVCVLWWVRVVGGEGWGGGGRMVVMVWRHVALHQYSLWLLFAEFRQRGTVHARVALRYRARIIWRLSRHTVAGASGRQLFWFKEHGMLHWGSFLDWVEVRGIGGRSAQVGGVGEARLSSWAKVLFYIVGLHVQSDEAILN